MLNESASVSLIIVDVLVDGLVTYGEGSAESQGVRDLLWAPVLPQQGHDVFPAMGVEVEAAPHTSPPRCCIAMGHVGPVPAIDWLLVASEFPTDSTR